MNTSLAVIRTQPLQPVSMPDELSGATFVRSLRQEALSHRGVRHPYLARLQQGDLPNPRAALRDLCYQYWGYSTWFQRYLLGAISQTESARHRAALMSNLHEETGMLSPEDEAQLVELDIDPEWVRGVPHPELYRRFLAAIGLQAADDDLCEPVLIWREMLWRLCSHSGFATAVGALGVGTECIVRAVYEPWTEAIRQHLDVSPRDRVFFDLHTHIDDEHAEVFENIAVELADTAEGRRQLRFGVMGALFLRNAFFDAMELRAESQPVS